MTTPVYYVTACMGRLGHLKRSVSSVLERTDWSAVVVDWSCPDGSGDWAESLGDPRVKVVRGLSDFGPRGRPLHPPKAKNLGARAVPREGDPILVFGDPGCCAADGRALSSMAGGLSERDAAYVFRSMWASHRGLGGFLMIRSSAFDSAGGFAEWLTDWSPDDFEMRIRLHFLGLRAVRVDPSWLSLSCRPGELIDKRGKVVFDSMRESWAAISSEMTERWGVTLDQFTGTPEGADVLDRTDASGKPMRLENPPAWLLAERERKSSAQ